MTRRKPPPPPDAKPLVDIKAFEHWTDKEQRFVRAYMRHGNAGRAVKEAGYEVNTPGAMYTLGYELLQRPHVRHFVDRLGEEIRRNEEVTVERLVSEMAAIAFANPAALVDQKEVWLDDGKDVPEAERLTAQQKRELGRPPDRLVTHLNLDHATSRDFAAIAGFKETEYGLQVTYHSKIGALDMLGKHKRMFVDRIEIGLAEDLTERMRRARERSMKLIEGEADGSDE